MTSKISLLGLEENNMITLENIHLQIEDQLLLENESIKIYDRCIHVIMGESGAGKTTLLYEISLLAHLSRHTYQWDQRNISFLDENTKADLRRNHIGYILQDLELISENLTLQDNLDCMFALVGKEYDQELVDQYMQQMNLHCSLSQHVEMMSRGERQRFALVLALIKDAKLIICDEPTSALDKENAVELMKHLSFIAKEYHKMIVIATHDDYVGGCADILYRIKNKHLICMKHKIPQIGEMTIKDVYPIKKRFYKQYQKGNRKFSQLVQKIIYVMMIVLVCIGPQILNTLLEKQEELYQLYGHNEIIIVNTKEKSFYLTYSQISNCFNNDKINKLKKINHVDNIEYYYEMGGILESSNGSEIVYIIPKKDIENVVLSSTLAKSFKEGRLQATLVIENKEYQLKKEISSYEIKDYPHRDNIDSEIIYIPYSMLKDMLQEYNIEGSSSISITCDDIKYIESLSSEIQNKFRNATITITDSEFLEQMINLKTMQQYIQILKIVIIVGITTVVIIVQTMENKSKLSEINNLRINGLNKKGFYRLYYQGNRFLILSTIMSCILTYIFMFLIFKLPINLEIFVIVILESIFYLFITRICPIYLSLQNIFSKEISIILRERT